MSRRKKYTKIPQLDVACNECKKIKSENVDLYEEEAQERISYDTKNIDETLSYLNRFVHGLDDNDEPIIDDNKYEDSLKDRILNRINEAGAKVIFDKKEVKRAKTKKDYYTDRGHNTRESVIAEGIIFQFSHELAMKMLDEDGMLDEDSRIKKGSTIPKDGKIQKWIADTYKFACGKWGKENVVGAYFHLDEYTPHLHVFVVPLEMRDCVYAHEPVLDENGQVKRKGVLNAKKLFSPQTIKELWKEYAEAMKGYGATAAKGIIPKAQYDNVASLTQMARSLSNSIAQLEEMLSKAQDDYNEAEANVVNIHEEIAGLKEEKKGFEGQIEVHKKKKKELAQIKSEIEEHKKELEILNRQLHKRSQFFSSLDEIGLKKYLDELPSRINTEVGRRLNIRGLFHGFFVTDVGKVDGSIAIKLTNSTAESIILQIQPDGRALANGTQLRMRDNSPFDLSEISNLFTQISPEAQDVFDSIFLRQGHAIREHENQPGMRIPVQQSHRSNADASKNKGEIDYGEKKEKSITL